MSEKIKNDFINEDELTAAQAEANESTDVYVHKFKKTFEFEDKVFDELTFKWSVLTGADSLAIENELQSLGKVIVTPEFSCEYLIRLAARACNEKIGSDLISALPLRDFNKIRSKARSFLMSAEV